MFHDHKLINAVGTFGRRRFSQTTIVLLLSIPILALYFPCALWLDADYQATRNPTPVGAVAHLGYFAPHDDNSLTEEVRATRHRFFQTVFRWTDAEWPVPTDGAADPHIHIYENGTSLGSPVIFYVPYSKSYALSFYTSDDTDPRRNGRDYWIVRR